MPKSCQKQGGRGRPIDKSHGRQPEKQYAKSSKREVIQARPTLQVNIKVTRGSGSPVAIDRGWWRRRLGTGSALARRGVREAAATRWRSASGWWRRRHGTRAHSPITIKNCWKEHRCPSIPMRPPDRRQVVSKRHTDGNVCSSRTACLRMQRTSTPRDAAARAARESAAPHPRQSSSTTSTPRSRRRSQQGAPWRASPCRSGSGRSPA